MLSGAEQAALDEQGYLFLPGLLDPATVAALTRRFDELVEAEGDEAGLEAHQESGTDRLANLVDKDPLFDVCWNNPRQLLEIPHEHPRLRPGARIGVWAATKLATDAGGWRQINRAGHPMMWPIFWPDDTDFSNPANTRHPSAGTSADPHGYGEAVARDLYPDVLSYTVGTPAVYGFAARNGRTIADNAPEAMLSLVANTAVPSGLQPSVASQARRDTFPYVVPA